jgi:hypothetical protein
MVDIGCRYLSVGATAAGIWMKRGRMVLEVSGILYLSVLNVLEAGLFQQPAGT